jgi:hypothetical protein
MPATSTAVAHYSIVYSSSYRNVGLRVNQGVLSCLFLHTSMSLTHPTIISRLSTSHCPSSLPTSELLSSPSSPSCCSQSLSHSPFISPRQQHSLPSKGLIALIKSLITNSLPKGTGREMSVALLASALGGFGTVAMFCTVGVYV